jgi:sugar (pentulose or hexulose) kinase
MELKDEALFMRRHAPTLEARVEVVDPPEAAALACAIKACMEIQTVCARRELG